MGKILVTGGVGFIGGYLTKSLLDSGEDVVIVDNLQSKKGAWDISTLGQYSLMKI